MSPKLRAASRTREVTAWICTTSTLVSLTAIFALSHWQYWRRTGDPRGATVAVQELIVVGVALARRRPAEVSRRAVDWAIALLASYSLLLLRPGGTAVGGLSAVWCAVQVAGGVCAIACLLRLGRSFGVVPANRGIKRTGPYRVVRHPIYASYVIAMTGYVLASPTIWNVLVCVFALGIQLRRIIAEEAILVRDALYRAYMVDVPWRLLPGAF